MAKLHIVYDPNDRISMSAEDLRQGNIKAAVLSVKQNLGHNELANTARELAAMLLEQVIGDDEG